MIQDAFGRTVTANGNAYTVLDDVGDSFTVNALTATAALATINAMAPAGWVPPPPPPVTTISALGFIRRWTASEQAVLNTANPLWAIQIAAANEIDVTDPTLLADVALAVAGGAVTQARADQVLDLSRRSP